MKTTTRLLTIAATVVLFGGTATWADDPALQNRLALQRQVTPQNQTTIAFYGHRKGIGRTAKVADRTELRVKEHTTPHGTAHYLVVPAK